MNETGESFYPPHPLRTHKEDTIHAAGIMSSAYPRPAGHLLLAFLSYQSFVKDFFCLQAVKPVVFYYKSLNRQSQLIILDLCTFRGIIHYHGKDFTAANI